jgi:hypothetical protein
VVVEHKRPEFREGGTYMESDKDVLVKKEIKSRENRRNSKISCQKLGHQIRPPLQLHTLQKSKLTTVEVPVMDPRTWSRVDTKEQVEELLVKHNVEQFSHAGDTPFGYSALGDQLEHKGDTPMSDNI